MKQKLVSLKILLLLFAISTYQITIAQGQTNKIVQLSTLLDKISNNHKIFFTYDANLILRKRLEELKSLYSDELITKEEYEKKKKQILDNL